MNGNLTLTQLTYSIPRAVAVVILLCGLSSAWAVTAVNPNGVNVNHTGITSVFLTFQNLGPNEQAVEAFWCGEVIATGVSAFNPCVGGTVLGTLPARNNLSRSSGTAGVNNLTDIMTIPASVTRRALQQAQNGADATFFYIRHFSDGISDTYVTVTCRMAGGGARSPLALTDVQLLFETEDGLRPVYFLARNEQTPPLNAKINYNGSGRLTGRWEVVMPGDPEPTAVDLLTEATLPLEQRASQRRYTLLSRFDIFLPPTSEAVLPGPDPAHIPTHVDGPYKILLRVEASAEKEGNSDTLAGTVVSGGIAGFPLPMLRYFIGTPESLRAMRESEDSHQVILLTPSAEANVSLAQPLVFAWQTLKDVPLYQLVVEADGEVVLDAVVKSSSAQYVAPPWLSDFTGRELRWRVQALAVGGNRIGNSPWRTLVIASPQN